jgi:hypothetical protein
MAGVSADETSAATRRGADVKELPACCKLKSMVHCLRLLDKDVRGP